MKGLLLVGLSPSSLPIKLGSLECQNGRWISLMLENDITSNNFMKVRTLCVSPGKQFLWWIAMTDFTLHKASSGGSGGLRRTVADCCYVRPAILLTKVTLNYITIKS